eukprot:3467328-Prymnesium_polylepis.1
MRAPHAVTYEVEAGTMLHDHESERFIKSAELDGGEVIRFFSSNAGIWAKWKVKRQAPHPAHGTY